MPENGGKVENHFRSKHPTRQNRSRLSFLICDKAQSHTSQSSSFRFVLMVLSPQQRDKKCVNNLTTSMGESINSLEKKN
jgi:hypothetical protein